MAKADDSGIVLQPSPMGVHLFLWAYGLGHKSVADFLKPELTFPIDENVVIEGEKGMES